MIAPRLVSRTLPVLRPAGARWRHRSELQWVAAAAPRLLSQVEAVPGDGWRTEAVRWTGTSVAVAVVAHRGSARRLVVKIPAAAEGAASLRRQVRVLSALARDPRLQDWQAVLPRPLHEGEIHGRYYCIEEALPGEQGTRLLRRGGRASAVLDASARLIHGLHSRTAQDRPVDDAAVEAWVELPLRRLERLADSRVRCRELRAGVDRLRRDLSGSLQGRTVRLSWIHGDYWPGNVLASARSGRITGIVDWDQGAADQLRLHDLLHLYLYARCLRRGLPGLGWSSWQSILDPEQHRERPAPRLSCPASQRDSTRRRARCRRGPMGRHGAASRSSSAPTPSSAGPSFRMRSIPCCGRRSHPPRSSW